MIPGRHTIVVSLMVLGLSACASPETVEDLPVDTAPREEPQIEEAPDVQPEPDPLEGVSLVECDDLERQLVSLPITQQTEAFVAGDFDTAYSMASPSFRAAVPQEVFEQLIGNSYGPLLQTTDLRFDDCLIEREQNFATLDARFTQGGLDVFGLRYVVSETEEGWRVDGASDLEVVGTGT